MHYGSKITRTNANSTRQGLPIKPKWRGSKNQFNRIFDGEDAPDYRESKEFKAYVALVHAIIHNATEPIALRSIRDQLGEIEYPLWTADAIEYLDGKTITSIGVQWVRYVPFTPEPRTPMQIDGEKQNEWNRHQRMLGNTYPTVAMTVEGRTY